ncbi:imm11 family protein [Winogradskyella sp. HB-48]|uniref:imm11 family protein n=1 Tax=Winogradskyella sp. HB-48 TaxID=3416808 RepID=UPI003CF7F627
MMKYFSINNSLNEKIMGHLPQVKEVVHNCHISDNPNFIDRFPFEKIEVNPILSNAVLYSKSNQTDLIHTSSIGFSYGSMLINDKFKTILEQFNCFGIQFYSTYIIHKEKKIDNYWQTHIYDIPYDFIDFTNTALLLKYRDENGKPIQNYLERVSNKEEFLNMVEIMKYPKMLFLKNISFVKEMDIDYFFLRNYESASLGIVSEKLKNEIEEQKITGIEFRPIDVSLNDWLGSNGLREKIYGRIPQMRPDGSIRK